MIFLVLFESYSAEATILTGSSIIKRISTDASDAQAMGVSSKPSISRDGRYVVFQSTAANLVYGDTNNLADLFLKDNLTGAITRISTSATGGEANGESYNAAISMYGQYVVFSSTATNLVPGDAPANCLDYLHGGTSNPCVEIFLKDTQTGEVKLVSADPTGQKATGNSYTSSISADGRYAAFDSNAANLVYREPGQCQSMYSSMSLNCVQFFVKDLQTGEIMMGSTSNAGAEANKDSDGGMISADGRFLTFNSRGSNLISGDTNATSDIFVKNLQSGVVNRASTTSSGGQSSSSTYQTVISPDGRFVVFGYGGMDLVAGTDRNSFLPDVFIKDTLTGSVSLVSQTQAGISSNNPCYSGTVSEDGRFVTFTSRATNLVPGTPRNISAVFVKDLATGELTDASISQAGEMADGENSWPVMSGDGRYIAFASEATNLVPGDSNAVEDVFLALASPLHASNILPSGNINSSSIAMEADLETNDSGLDPASVVVKIDDVGVSGCVLNLAHVQCPLTGLTEGQHTISISYSANDEIPGAGQGTFTLTPLSAGNILPAGFIGGGGATIEADLEANSSGIDSGSLIVSLDGSAVSDCSLSEAHVQCPVTGIAEGQHTVDVSYSAVDGVPGRGAGSFTVDLTQPIISGLAPAGWTNGQINLSATMSDTGSGINSGSVSVYLDGAAQSTLLCSINSSSISCPYFVLPSGHHTFQVSVMDQVGNSASASGEFVVDNVQPEITNTQPHGILNDRVFEISADYSDADSGIKTGSVRLTINGHDSTQYATISDTGISFMMGGGGAQSVYLTVPDNVGNITTEAWTFTAPSNYYFPWYDTISGKTWVLMSMPDSSQNNSFDVFLRNGAAQRMDTLSAGGPVGVAKGSTAPQYYGGRMDGPVKVTAREANALISERSLFGNSFEEVWATPYEDLDSHYYWPVYDGVGAAGMRSWVLVANPPDNPGAIEVEVRVHVPSQADRVFTTTLQPGQSATPEFPGVQGGPVEVTSWRSGGSKNNPADAARVITSERVLYNGAFNEMPGIPEWSLSPAWLWTWYDNNSPGASNWICIGNPNQSATYVVVIAGDSLLFEGYVPAGGTVPVQAPRGDPGGLGGPVMTMSCDTPSCESFGPDIYATQRVIWGPSFSEISGSAFIDNNAHWTWYDNANPGTTNWVLLSNLELHSSIYAEIKIGGVLRWAGYIPPFSNVTPTFPGLMAGPVEVKAWTNASKQTPTEIFASQRVLWNGYFNEIVGKAY